MAEGQNLLVERRHGGQDRLSELAAELVRLKVDAIVTPAVRPTLAAKAATTTIPIVFLAADPVTYGLVASLAKPGGNVSGIAVEPTSEVYGKQLEILKETVPALFRVGVPVLPHQKGDPELDQIRVAASALGVKVEVLVGRERHEFEKALVAMRGERGDGLLIQPIPFFFEHQRWIVELAAKQRLSAMYPA